MAYAALILVVDDDLNDLELISDSLSELDADIAVATDSRVVFEQVLKDPPDLILMDVMMPGMDGFDVCARLKSDSSTRDIPLIFMTASADPDSRMKGLHLGASDYITKPCQRGELLARVQVHLRMRTLTKTLEEQNARLKQEIAERAAMEITLQKLTQQLQEANQQLQVELAEREHSEKKRERSEKERAALQEEIIRVQSDRLAEMATPLIPITDRIMVMPLIGAMDAERSQQVLATALHGAQGSRAEVVIIDITGVKRIDGDVAGSLMSTAGALRLLGTQVMITGIGAEVAQTLVQLGIHLDNVVTCGTLQSGIAYALKRSLA